MSLTDFLFAFSAQEVSTGLTGSTLPSNLTELADSQLPDSFLNAYYIGNLLKKTERLQPWVDTRRKKVLDKFLEREKKNEVYNRNFTKLFEQEELKDFLVNWRAEMHYFFRGYTPQMKGRMTTGATTSSKKGAHAFDRFIHAECTSLLADFLESEEGMFIWKPTFKYKRTNWSVVSLVPKDINNYRLINPEPAVNAYYQCGVGTEIKYLLHRAGIPLPTGQDKHKALAWYGSITGEYATADLSNASWGIYNALVAYLTPHEWYAWMKKIRSPGTYIEECVPVPYSHELQQFATMGNGFCFELETAIFYTALCAIGSSHGIPRSEMHVYGDDLIYPTSIDCDVKRLFRKVGFDINVDKSFSTGLFRESCGGDYYNGVNIRPLHFKKYLGTNSYEKTMMANQLFDWLLTHDNRRMRKLRLQVIRSIPHAERLWGPPAMGDMVLKTQLEHRWKIRQRSKFDLPRLKAFKLKHESFLSLEGLEKLRDPIKIDLHQNLAMQGFLAGWGERVVHKRANEGFVEERMYIKHPDPAGRFSPQKTWSTFFSANNGVDETHPLSIFEVLPKTGCPARLYAADYQLRHEADKVKELSRLASLLTHYLGARAYHSSSNGYTDEQFMDDISS